MRLFHISSSHVSGPAAILMAATLALALARADAPEQPVPAGGEFQSDLAQAPAPAPPPAAQPVAAQPSAQPTPPPAPAEAPQDPVVKHTQGSEKLAKDQDELSADVKQLILEQTADKVIKLFDEVKNAMNDATDNLTTHDTGGTTIAAETDVIEKIIEAAKERQKQKGGQGNSPMTDMMDRMAGKEEPKPGDKGDKPGDKTGDSPGQGQTGDSNAANESINGAAGGKDGSRRVPKAAGTTGQPLPAEFRQALDAYNRGAEKLAK